MMRWIFQLAVVGSLLVAAIDAGAIRLSTLAVAQEDAADLGVDLPDGIDLESLASGVATSLPAAPVDLRLERVTVGAGGDTGLRVASGPELLFVETGTLLITDEIGIEAAHPEQSQLLVPMGASYGIRNDGGDDAVLLRVGLASEESDSQTDTNAGSNSAKSETLLQANVTSLPGAPARVFLGRATWEPGAEIDQQAFTGPVGLFGEQGTLTVAGPSGIEGQLPEGKGVVFPGGAPSSQRNAGADTVVTLVVGIIPADGGLIAPIAQTPSTSTDVDETATPSANQTLAPGVLYEADSSGGFDEWSLTGGWKIFRGMLVNDGGGGTINAPYDPKVDGYAIEAEIQVVPPENENQGFGFSIGEDSARVSIRPVGSASFSFFVGEERAYYLSDFVEIEFDWQTYRLEIDGNRVALSIGGVLIFEVIDNRLLSMSLVPGLFTGGEQQVNVRSFRIVELDEPSADGVEIAERSAEGATNRVHTVAPGSLSNPTFDKDMMAGNTLLAELWPGTFVATEPQRGFTVPRKMRLRRGAASRGTRPDSARLVPVQGRACGIRRLLAEHPWWRETLPGKRI